MVTTTMGHSSIFVFIPTDFHCSEKDLNSVLLHDDLTDDNQPEQDILPKHLYTFLYFLSHQAFSHNSHQVKKIIIVIVNNNNFMLHILINWFIKCYKAITSEALFLPRDGQNHLRYSLHPPTEGWPGWVGLTGLDKYRDCRPAEGRHQSQY